MSDTNTRQAKRTPVTLKIKFKSETLSQFIERYSVDISHGGIFIRTKDPLQVGTTLRFEFQLKDASPLITGDGTVVWTREHDPARVGVAPGMGVRFDRLTPKSKEILDKILAKKAAKSPGAGNSFEQDPTRVAPSPVIADLADNAKRATSDSFADDGSDSTPLPKPIPFHSDADEFPEEAFSEATRVTDLDELAAKTADAKESAKNVVRAGGKTAAKVAAKPRKKSANVPAGEEPAEKTRIGHEPGRAETSKEADEIAKHKAEQARKKAEAHARKVKTVVEAAKDPRKQAVKQRLLQQQLELASEKGDDIASELAQVGEQPKSNGLWIAAGVAMLVVAVGGGGLYVMNKGAQGDKDEIIVQTAPDTADTEAPEPAAEPKPVAKPKGVGEGDATATIESVPPGATIEVLGTPERGTAPTTIVGMLANKTYSVKVSKPGYKPEETQITGGATEVTKVTLVAIPRTLKITTKPPGATISINGKKIAKLSPVTVPLKGELATADTIDVDLSLAGFTPTLIQLSMADDFKLEGGTMVHTLDRDLSKQEEVAVVRRPPRTSGGSSSSSSTTTSGGSTSSSTTTSGSGSTTTGSGTTTSGSTTTKPPPKGETKEKPTLEWM